MPPDVFDGDQCVSNMIACFRRKTIFEIPPIRYNSVFTCDADVLAKYYTLSYQTSRRIYCYEVQTFGASHHVTVVGGREWGVQVLSALISSGFQLLIKN